MNYIRQRNYEILELYRLCLSGIGLFNEITKGVYPCVGARLFFGFVRSKAFKMLRWHGDMGIWDLKMLRAVGY